MQEIRLDESFDSGEITIRISGEITAEKHKNVLTAAAKLTQQIERLVENSGANVSVVPRGEAQDPSVITSRLPGVNIIDRRRKGVKNAKR